MNIEEQIKLIENDPDNYVLIKNPNLEIKMRTLSLSWKTIEYIKNPSREMQMLAVLQNASAIKLINEPCLKVLETAKRINPNLNGCINEIQQKRKERLNKNQKSKKGK